MARRRCPSPWFPAPQANPWRESGSKAAPGNRTWAEIPYYRNQEGPYIRFEDPQGAFVVKDTTLADLRDREIVVKLDSVQ